MLLLLWQPPVYTCVCIAICLVGVTVCLPLQTHVPYCRDLERLDSPTYSVKAHEGIINTIDGCGGLGIGGGAPEIVTGSRDGETYSFPQRSTASREEVWSILRDTIGSFRSLISDF